jgi:hypothetical protein
MPAAYAARRVRRSGMRGETRRSSVFQATTKGIE